MNPFGIPDELYRSWIETGIKTTEQAMRANSSALPSGALPPAMQRAFEAQTRFFQQFGALTAAAWMRQMGGEPKPVVEAEPGDKRFKSPSWNEDPAHDFLKQAYLITERYMRDLVDRAEVDERTRERLSFYTRQVTEAMSPANLLATNPEALRLATETKGESLIAGMKNFFDDLGKGRLSQTDESAFKVGVNLATTPGAVVYENEIFQLIQYAPVTETVDAKPLLLVPPCINKFYILDMQADSSFVRHALAAGNTVFLVSWRNVGPEQGHLTWEDYIVDGVTRAIDTVLAITGADQINALGFCVGGTMLSTTVALMAGRGERKVAALTLLATMIDFIDTGEIGLLIDEQSVAKREQAIGRHGILPARDLAFVFSSLRGNDLIWSYVVNNYLKGGKPPAFDLLYWNADATNVPGPWYTWYIRNTYLENNIRVPGRVKLRGQPLDFGRLDMPIYLLATREDHIVPWGTAFATSRLVNGPTRFVLGASGHVAGIVNPPAKRKRNYWSDGTLGQTAEFWLETATEHKGSWWTDWSAWLAQQSNAQVPARKILGSKALPPIEPAPGRYVVAPA